MCHMMAFGSNHKLATFPGVNISKCLCSFSICFKNLMTNENYVHLKLTKITERQLLVNVVNILLVYCFVLFQRRKVLRHFK